MAFQFARRRRFTVKDGPFAIAEVGSCQTKDALVRRLPGMRRFIESVCLVLLTAPFAAVAGSGRQRKRPSQHVKVCKSMAVVLAARWSDCLSHCQHFLLSGRLAGDVSEVDAPCPEPNVGIAITRADCQLLGVHFGFRQRCWCGEQPEFSNCCIGFRKFSLPCGVAGVI